MQELAKRIRIFRSSTPPLPRRRRGGQGDAALVRRRTEGRGRARHAGAEGLFIRRGAHWGVGSAQVAKAVNNLIMWACLVADHEGSALAQRYGVDVEMLRRALGLSSAANSALDKWGTQTMAWAEDDMAIVAQMAADCGLRCRRRALPGRSAGRSSHGASSWTCTKRLFGGARRAPWRRPCPCWA